MTILEKFIIPAQRGKAFRISAGQLVKVIDIEGKQGADFTAVNASNIDEAFSSGVTLDCNGSFYLKPGDCLFSNHYNKLLQIIADTVGTHDLIHPTCSQRMYETHYQVKGSHPSCHENMQKNLKEFDIDYSKLQTQLNLFMNTTIESDGRIKINPPVTKPGDFILLKACIDLIVCVTACSAEESICNDFACKPIGIEILSQ